MFKHMFLCYFLIACSSSLTFLEEEASKSENDNAFPDNSCNRLCFVIDSNKLCLTVRNRLHSGKPKECRSKPHSMETLRNDLSKPVFLLSEDAIEELTPGDEAELASKQLQCKQETGLTFSTCFLVHEDEVDERNGFDINACFILCFGRICTERC